MSEESGNKLLYAASLGIGVLLGMSFCYFMDQKPKKPKQSKKPKQKGTGAPFSYTEDDYFKMVLLVREDLKMSGGKIGAQCGHAAVGACLNMLEMCPEVLELYEDDGSPKIVLSTKSLKELKERQIAAEDLGLPTYLVVDAGRTQVEPGSKTVLAIGPAPVDLIDKVTGNMGLYRK
eukprot:TRINITY_DN3167_c0_g1_i1.p1 TRINITY_DN3167_c0_g1~~TRINITY_DN3167_c0_g1_i1.p1  ORF type:complete len:183 (-),score=43.05 TRINITY_DN3167_c0_g1_i1:12-539(-)